MKLPKKLLHLFSRKNKRSNNEVTYEEAQEIIKVIKDTVLIDVRSPQEYGEYHLPGSISIPIYELELAIKQDRISKQSTIILYCQTGSRSKQAMNLLMNKGYQNVYNIQGGLDNM